MLGDGRIENSRRVTAKPFSCFIGNFSKKEGSKKIACKKEQAGKKKRSKEKEPALREDVVFVFMQEKIHIEKVIVRHKQDVFF